MSVGYLADSFDLINVRDLDLIAQAKALCSELVIGVFTDEYAERLYGRRPVVPFVERMTLVGHVRGIHRVVEHDSGTQQPLEQSHVVFAGSDQPFEPQQRATLLEVRRRSTSDILRNALQPTTREAVA